jgi:hypothetical protein
MTALFGPAGWGRSAVMKRAVHTAVIAAGRDGRRVLVIDPAASQDWVRWIGKDPRS